MSIIRYIFAFLLAFSFHAILTSGIYASSVLTPTAGDAEVAIITGQVTSEVTGMPVANVNVFLIDTDALDTEILGARTDSSGLYTVTQIVSNTWILKFAADTSLPDSIYFYLDEYYDDVFTLSEAAPITAEVGTVIPNINVALASRGQISGRVTSEADGSPIANVFVEGFQLGEDEETVTSSTHADSTGAYTLTTYLGGEFKLRFTPPYTTEYAIEYWDNAHNLSEASIVTAQENIPLYGVDIALAQGGSIKGFVNSTWQGIPILYPHVAVYNEAGELIQFGARREGTQPGTYTATNLPSGQYTLDFNASRHIGTLYPLSVTVVAGEVTPNINTQLQKYLLVNSIATSPSAPGLIGLTFQDEPAPYLSQDGGNRWQIVPHTTWAVAPTTDQYADMYNVFDVNLAITPRGLPGEGTRLVVSAGAATPHDNINKGIYRSGDYGQSWETSSLPAIIAAETCTNIGSNKLQASPVEPSTLYLVNQCNLVSPFLLYVSHDSGVTWNDLSTVGSRVLHLSETIVPSPLVKDRLYALDDSGEWLQSDDAGQNWTEKNFPLEILSPDSQNENVLYGLSTIQDGPDGYSTRIGKRSTDGGNSWQDWAEQPCPYAALIQPPSLMAHPTQANIIFMLCNNNLTEGLYRSDNGGDNWAKLSDIDGQLLAPDYGTHGRILWARLDGLYASSDAGVTWQALLPDYRLLARPLYLPAITTKPN